MTLGRRVGLLAAAFLLPPTVAVSVFTSWTGARQMEDLIRLNLDLEVSQFHRTCSDEYGALKALSEKAAETSMPGKVAVVRPGLIVGPEDPSDRFTYWPLTGVFNTRSPSRPAPLGRIKSGWKWVSRLFSYSAAGVWSSA